MFTIAHNTFWLQKGRKDVISNELLHWCIQKSRFLLLQHLLLVDIKFVPGMLVRIGKFKNISPSHCTHSSPYFCTIFLHLRILWLNNFRKTAVVCHLHPEIFCLDFLEPFFWKFSCQIMKPKSLTIYVVLNFLHSYVYAANVHCACLHAGVSTKINKDHNSFKSARK